MRSLGLAPSDDDRTSEDHMTKLNQLGFTTDEEINQVITLFEKGMSDPLNFPLMADDLSNLPPAYVLACENDTLRDDAILYAQRLENAGNEVALDYQAQGWHAMLVVSTEDITVTTAANAFQNIIQQGRRPKRNHSRRHSCRY